MGRVARAEIDRTPTSDADPSSTTAGQQRRQPALTAWATAEACKCRLEAAWMVYSASGFLACHAAARGSLGRARAAAALGIGSAGSQGPSATRAICGSGGAPPLLGQRLIDRTRPNPPPVGERKRSGRLRSRPGMYWRPRSMMNRLISMISSRRRHRHRGQPHYMCMYVQHCRSEPRNIGDSDVANDGRSSQTKFLRSMGRQASCPSGRRVPCCSGSSASSTVGPSVPAG
eukprot:COSAG03_NODE_32_length_18233_cov_11.266847_15_plen_230_part_00